MELPDEVSPTEHTYQFEISLDPLPMATVEQLQMELEGVGGATQPEVATIKSIEVILKLV